MTSKSSRSADGRSVPSFNAVPVRPRADGWTTERQTAFIEALAASGNVEAAARAVGMTRQSAYDLRARPDAASFREAWNIALDYAVHRLREAVLERAIEGAATPIFYKGELVGERRRYDDRLAMFVLRMRDPEGFGSWREGRIPIQHPDAQAIRLQVALTRVEKAAAEDGFSQLSRKPIAEPMLLTPEEKHHYAIIEAERAEKAKVEAEARRSDGNFEEWLCEVDTEVDKERGA